MRTAIEIVRWAELVAYAALAVAALVQWRRRRGRPALWAALAFGVLGAVVVVARLLPDEPRGAEEWVVRVFIAVLLLFPYLLYRFAMSFETNGRRWSDWIATAVTAAVVAWTFAVPDIPSASEERPPAWTAFVAAVAVQWVVVLTFVVAQLWRAGRGQARLARWRMRLLALAAGALALAIVASVSDPPENSPLALSIALLGLGSAVSFFLGLAPPAYLRWTWRRPEDEQLRRAMVELIAATTEDEVKERVLPQMAASVGARAITLVDKQWNVLASWPEASTDTAEQGVAEEDAVRLDVPSGAVLVRASRYAPFFGGDDLERMRSITSLTLLALDRARLFAQEREARQVLERAAELQNRFIALASHELRTPAATVYGTAATLHLRGDALDAEQRLALHRVLFEQTERLRALVEQLLDLSRLEANAIDIRPQPMPIRRRVEELVKETAGDRAEEVGVEVPSSLVAHVDAVAFDRILSNLVVNALRYGEPPIRVTATYDDGDFRVAVEDAGSGVPAEFVPELFEPFTRSEPSRATDSVGTGLGLAIARSYAHAHGGDLLYEPVRPHGARFVLVVPNGAAPE